MKKDNSNRALGPFFLSLNEIRPHLLNPHLKDNELVRLIKEMSEKFTKKREHIEDYVLSDDFVSSYAALYLPTNIPKLNFVLNKLPNNILEDIFQRTFIDVGSGPGTYSLGMCLEKGEALKEIYCIDSSKSMLNQAKKMLEGFFPEANVKYQTSFTNQATESVLFFGHSINEMGIKEASRLIAKVNPEYIMWIEPGTSLLFPELLKLRTELAQDYDVLYPCPSMLTCPNDWCHQVLRTSHENSIERLSQMVSLDRKILPLVAHVYKRKKELSQPSQRSIITRFICETKFSFEYEVCSFLEGKNQILQIEIQKKNLSKELEKEFKNLNVGETIEFQIEKTIGQKHRVKLI